MTPLLGELSLQAFPREAAFSLYKVFFGALPLIDERQGPTIRVRACNVLYSTRLNGLESVASNANGVVRPHPW